MEICLTPHQKHSIAFSCLILITGLMAMDFISPSLPYIMHSLHTNEAGTKPLIVFYMLGLSLSLFFYGTFSDNHGRKKTILLSYVISLIGIIWSSLSGSIGMLYFGRVINGIGNGGATVIARAIITDTCEDPKSLKQAFSYFTMFGVLSPAIAPLLGGLIQQYFNNWRFSFLGLLIVTVITCLVVHFFMPETRTNTNVKTSLLEQSKVYLSLLSLKQFMIYNVASATIYIFSISYYAFMPFILFKIHYSPVENGILFSVYALSLLVGSFSLAKYFNKYSSEMIFGYCCVAFIVVSCLFYICFSFFSSTISILLFTLILSFICGLSAPLTLALSMYGFASDKKGAASAVQSFMKMFFTGIALLLFNFISLRSPASLLFCYIILAFILLILFLMNKFLFYPNYELKITIGN